MKQFPFFSVWIAICLLPVLLTAQDLTFRSGVFFHHSTGANIWGPNGSNTSVPLQIEHYNLVHGLSGTLAVGMTETWFPVYNDNEWATWHTIFEESIPEGICTYCATNPIIMIKSCYPSSNIESWGQPSDTLTPTLKTVYNYKRHWRHIVNVMKSHPEHFFIIWTNAPQVQNLTNPNEATRSHWFSKWAKDTLAQGLDPIFETFPPNVYVFDFFHKLANAQGYLNPLYAVSAWDSHPNAAATALVAPQLVDEMFNAAITYELSVSLKDIDGFLTYDNAAQTPISGRKVYLRVGCCTLVDSTITDANGYFLFADKPVGAYVLKPDTVGAFGGVNSDDAFLILKHFVGMSTLTGLHLDAANLNADHVVNTTDALMAAKRFVGLINSFPVGNWCFQSTQVTLTGTTNISVAIKGLCFGDVNASYMP